MIGDRQVDPVVHHTAFVNQVLADKLKQGTLKRLYVAEILEAIDEEEAKADKKKILMNNAQPALLELLRLTYDPNITYDLAVKDVGFIIKNCNPMEIPDYDMAPASMYTEARRLKYFTSISPNKLAVPHQEKMLSSMFSAMHENDRELIRCMFTKKLPIRGLTEALVRECFPRLLSPVATSGYTPPVAPANPLAGGPSTPVSNDHPDTMVKVPVVGSTIKPVVIPEVGKKKGRGRPAMTEEQKAEAKTERLRIKKEKALKAAVKKQNAENAKGSDNA